MVEMIDSKLVAGNGTRTINNGGGSIFVFLFQPWVGIIVLLVTVYTIGKYRYQWKDSDVEYTYKSAWVKGELWRTGLASISHSDVLHLVYSLLGVLWTGIANRGVTWKEYFVNTMAFILIARIFQIICMSAIKGESMRKIFDRPSMGFTAPVVGWLVLGAFNTETPRTAIRGHYLIPISSLAPVIMVALSKVMLLRNVSSLEQMGGGVAGLLAVVGVIEAFSSSYWLSWALIWVYLTLGMSIKATTSLLIPLLDYARTRRPLSEKTGVIVCSLDWENEPIFEEYALDGT